MSAPSNDDESNVSPLYLWPPLAKYRATRQGNSKWPEDVDAAFMDALLLIPPLGKNAALFQGQRCGQNGLILRYIELRLGRDMEIDRKHISHHKTYIKQRLKDHPLYHFFFREEVEEQKDDQTPGQSSILKALSENRLPDNQINYNYFASLVQGGREIHIRPLRCSFDLRITNDDQSSLAFHSFTSSLSQTVSRSLPLLVANWVHKFPSVGENLLDLLISYRSEHQSIFRQVSGSSDIFHLDVEFTLAPTSKFLPQLHLGSDVIFEICDNNLKTHQWSCTTKFQMPWELSHLIQADPWTLPCRLGNDAAKLILELPIPSTIFNIVLFYLSEERETRAQFLGNMAMYQELWSTPSYEPGNAWSRQAVIIWTFSPERSKGGTSWRFLSQTDPSSLNHHTAIYSDLTSRS